MTPSALSGSGRAEGTSRTFRAVWIAWNFIPPSPLSLMVASEQRACSINAIIMYATHVYVCACMYVCVYEMK